MKKLTIYCLNACRYNLCKCGMVQTHSSVNPDERKARHQCVSTITARTATVLFKEFNLRYFSRLFYLWIKPFVNTMGTVTNFLLCSIVVVIAQGQVMLEADRPSLKVELFGKAVLECCYTHKMKSVQITWIRHGQHKNTTLEPLVMQLSDSVHIGNTKAVDKSCGILTLKQVSLNDSGLYQCWLNGSDVELHTHGTYLLVYKPLDKTINLSESTKNKILTAEGILLLLCVILPSANLLCQSKRINQLEKKKVKKEEENIYQGLNLDDCCTTYDQIERSQAHGPYEDVCNIMEEEEEIQLEKP
ncbi:B-cell antigen receptor complex-associated protein alpha chain [Siniperca chuatsi]|uniref:B-cell antigen receptor complex-associated protein alpha chain n=1 Tax=Siniperca chuatsi TaxID=119488 RepID=UPI001CE0EC3A|nr:B-cell antigen receptor complex-associated protein alpha chain [Siniperca chuatsi]